MATITERLRSRLWTGPLGPKTDDEIAVFIEEERKCDAEMRDRMRDTIGALVAAGQALSNCAYNLEQNSALATRDRVALKMSCEAWDAALAAARK